MAAHHAFNVNRLFHGSSLRLGGFIFRGRLHGAAAGGAGDLGRRRTDRGFALRRGIVGGAARVKGVQPQGICDDADAGQAHGRGGDHRVQRDAEAREHARRQRDADGVVEERPEQVLMDVAHHRAGQAHRGGYIGQVAAHQHNVGGVQCDVRTGTDGNAGLGAGQGGGVVDAVTDHGNAALLLQCADLGFLARGQDARNDMVGIEADSRADVAGRGGVVAGQHHDLQAERLHLGDGGGGRLLHDVGHADDACGLTGQREVERRDAVGAHLVARLLQVVGQGAGLADEIGIAARNDLARDLAAQTLAGYGLKVGHSGVGQMVLLGALQDGAGQWVLTAKLQTGGHAEQEFLGHVAGAEDFYNVGLTGGDGAGLIQQHGVGVAGGFEAGGGLEQDAVFGTHAAADHDGDGRRQAQGTGAADDQHADAAGQRKCKGLAQQQPDDKRSRGDTDDGGHEDAGDPVRGLGQRGLRRGGVAHQADDLGQRRVLADALGTAGQRTVLVDGRGADGGAGELVHRHALAGQGGLVDRGDALGDGAVHRDALTGAD